MGKLEILKIEKSTASCANNQQCLFNHSVIAHATVESILCQKSPVESTKQENENTMYLAPNELVRQSVFFNEPTVTPKNYAQDWSNYNLAQMNEKSRFQELLFELCSQIEDFPRKNVQGRNRIPLADMVFSIVYKIYTGISGRRFISDLATAHAKGFISKRPHFNSLYNYLELDEMYFILQSLIRESAAPLRSVEIDFAVDSSGFSKGQKIIANWNTAKHRDKNVVIGDWLKCHLICGVKTNIVANVEITEGTAHDYAQFKPLVQRTAQHFDLHHVTADKAYLSADNFRYVADRGGMAFIPFKSNSIPNRKKPDELWRNMFYFFQLRRNEFMDYYHKRSNVETTFSMIKAKFGERLRSKTEKAQINELLCKVLCHNLCCVVSAIYELGIETNFYRIANRSGDSDLMQNS
jgi:transposase